MIKTVLEDLQLNVAVDTPEGFEGKERACAWGSRVMSEKLSFYRESAVQEISACGTCSSTIEALTGSPFPLIHLEACSHTRPHRQPLRTMKTLLSNVWCLSGAWLSPHTHARHQNLIRSTTLLPIFLGHPPGVHVLRSSEPFLFPFL